MVFDTGIAPSGGFSLGRLAPPPRILDMQQEPQRAAFNAYRVAFRANQASPNLRNAHALVRSYSALMAAMGLPMPEASE